MNTTRMLFLAYLVVIVVGLGFFATMGLMHR